MSTGARTLWLAAFGAAAAWSADLLIAVSIGGARCLRSPDAMPRFGVGWWVLAWITIAAGAASAWALWASMRALHEAAGPHERRIRFMARAGLFLNVLFLAGLAFFAAALLLAPLC